MQPCQALKKAASVCEYLLRLGEGKFDFKSAVPYDGPVVKHAEPESLLSYFSELCLIVTSEDGSLRPSSQQRGC